MMVTVGSREKIAAWEMSVGSGRCQRFLETLPSWYNT